MTGLTFSFSTLLSVPMCSLRPLEYAANFASPPEFFFKFSANVAHNALVWPEFHMSNICRARASAALLMAGYGPLGTGLDIWGVAAGCDVWAKTIVDNSRTTE